jgi:hypothetical protein
LINSRNRAFEVGLPIVLVCDWDDVKGKITGILGTRGERGRVRERKFQSEDDL